MADGSLRLEDRLRALGDRIEFPSQPDLAASVRAAIEASPQRVPARRSLRLRVAFAATMVALLAGGVLVFSPTTRSAIADWIGLDGLEIDYGEPPHRDRLGTDLRLGSLTTLEDASAEAGFEIAPPTELGSPDEVYVAGTGPRARISLVYAVREGLPRTETTRVGLLLTAFRARITDDVVFQKSLGAGVQIERIDVDGNPGYWITGEEHVLLYRDVGGIYEQDPARLAGNTLAWQDGEIVYRLESALTRGRALEIARSVP